jgi:hypothetical protein
VFENGVLKKIFRPQRDEVMEDSRRLHKKELYDLYFSPNIMSIGRSGSVARIGRREVHTWFWWGNLRETDHLENLGIDGSIILMWIFKKWNGGMDWIDLAQDRERWQVVVNSVINLRVL